MSPKRRKLLGPTRPSLLVMSAFGTLSLYLLTTLHMPDHIPTMSEQRQDPPKTKLRASGKSGRLKFAALAKFLWLLVPLLLVIVFMVDMWTPVGVALPICYVAGLALVVALPKKRDKITAAATCTLLLIVHFVLAPTAPGFTSWVYILNHSLAILIIWTVTVLGVRHRHVQEGMRENERVANERLAHLNTIYASAPVGLCFVDRDLRYVSMNNALAEMNGRSPEYFIGKTVREAVPEFADGIETHYHRVIETGRPVIDEEIQASHPSRRNERCYRLCSYYPVHNENGQLLGVNVAVRDITGRKQAEADTLFLLDLGEGIRFAANADELLWAVAVALGEHLKASRCGFVEVDVEHDRLTVQRDYHPHMPSLVGSYPLNAFGSAVVNAAKTGQIIAVAELENDERTARNFKISKVGRSRDGSSSPLLRDGKLVSGAGYRH